MSLVQQILYTVSNYPGGYRTIYDLLYDGQAPGEKSAKSLQRNLRNTLSRMKRNKLLENKSRNWSITSLGTKSLTAGKTDLKKFFHSSNKKKRAQKQVIIIFDIPEKKRRYRDWLRYELITLGFEQVQKSAWFGPPLPPEFITYLDEEGMLKYIRFFRVAEGDLI